MGQLVASFFASLDLVVESPHLFVFPYFDAEVGAAVTADTEGIDAFLMGHRLYEEWSQHWPTSTDEPFASMINGVDKYVVASSDFEAEWSGTTVLSGSDVADQVRALKERSTRIAMSGCATTVRWLLEEGLLDELHLLVFPVAVGTGARLFADSRVPLELVSSRALPTGVLSLVYRPAPAPAPAAG